MAESYQVHTVLGSKTPPRLYKAASYCDPVGQATVMIFASMLECIAGPPGRELHAYTVDKKVHNICCR